MKKLVLTFLGVALLAGCSIASYTRRGDINAPFKR